MMRSLLFCIARKYTYMNLLIFEYVTCMENVVLFVTKATPSLYIKHIKLFSPTINLLTFCS